MGEKKIELPELNKAQKIITATGAIVTAGALLSKKFFAASLVAAGTVIVVNKDMIIKYIFTSKDRYKED